VGAGTQIALRPPQNGGNSYDLTKAPLVFVGYGVSAPEQHWDDFKGVDLKGKVAVVLVNDPDFEDAACANGCPFGGKAMTYYGRWTYKYEEMARRRGGRAGGA
jgi:Zn-dependent M28 family amino/carboxypeptidase